MNNKSNQLPKNTKTRKTLFIVLAIFGALTVFLIAAVIFMVTLSGSGSKSEFEPEPYLEPKTIESSYGFALTYDAAIIDASAAVISSDGAGDEKYSGKEYDGEELNQKRDYSIVTLLFKDRNKEDNKDKKGDKKEKDSGRTIFMLPSLMFSTSRKKDFFDRSDLTGDLKDESKYSDLDLMVEEEIAKGKEKSDYISHKVSEVNIKGKVFKKYELYRGASVKNSKRATTRYIRYMTVQNSRPYWVTITALAEPENSEYLKYLKRLEYVLTNIEFTEVDQSLLTRSRDNFTALAPKYVSDYSKYSC